MSDDLVNGAKKLYNDNLVLVNKVIYCCGAFTIAILFIVTLFVAYVMFTNRQYSTDNVRYMPQHYDMSTLPYMSPYKQFEMMFYDNMFRRMYGNIMASHDDNSIGQYKVQTIVNRPSNKNNAQKLLTNGEQHGYSCKLHKNKTMTCIPKSNHAHV